MNFLSRTKWDVYRVYSKWYSTKTKNIANNITILNKSSVRLSHLSPLCEEFIEWFRGFVDAEGCFLIIHRKGNTFEFEFSIKLHIDDKAVLEYILSKLGVGVIRVDRNGTSIT